MALRAACFAAAVTGSFLSHPIQDLRPPFDHGTGLCSEAFHAFEVEARFSLCVWGLAHTREEQDFALLCLYDGFCIYRSQITSRNVEAGRDLESLSSLSLCQREMLS